jgi:NAD(P)-dependent dehydrogenase (short-subunit alcohol dehydrogenase family)
LSGLCEGRVAVVTGAGRGIGRGHARELARQGARVVVNDLGVELDGQGANGSVAGAVVAEIVAEGGVAVADMNDVADFDGARRLVDHVVEEFGSLDIVVNNAGVLRDRTLTNLSWEDWDLVLRVHLGATFSVSRWAASWWRDRSKSGETVDARIVNTTSGAGLYGNPGQSNYSAAKAGVIGFTRTAAMELARYGVTVNAVGPGGRTRMTEKVFAGAMGEVRGSWDPFDPANVAPVVAWLSSPEARDVTGRVIEAWAGRIAVVEGWRPGPTIEIERRWEPAEVGPILRDLLVRASAESSMLAGGPTEGPDRA